MFRALGSSKSNNIEKSAARMPAADDDPKYQSGFGNYFSSEAIEGALPVGQNSPQVCPYGLYAEHISGTAFTAPRTENQRVFLYRMRPTVTHIPFVPMGTSQQHLCSDFEQARVTPNQLRWDPFEIPKDADDVEFLHGLKTVCGAGSTGLKDGYAIHVYSFNRAMEQSCNVNSDGDFLIVPQLGILKLTTELGLMHVAPGEIAVIQRGIRFKVAILGGCEARGYILEVFNGHFTLPDLGPIGANGLANVRDFQSPVAWFEEQADSLSYTVINKFQGQLFQTTQESSPFDVVAWHGNYAPYKYDLARFMPVSAVAFDHCDPSIFTVLTCQSTVPGTAIADFVIFPPRWIVAEHTFRPPYFHRNTMNEFMGLIRGTYDAKADGFTPGGASLHMCMTPHGPDTTTFNAATASQEQKPIRTSNDALAFMFEVSYTPRVFDWAVKSAQTDYYKCWEGLKSHFDPSRP